jgi:hypothetical protein
MQHSETPAAHPLIRPAPRSQGGGLYPRPHGRGRAAPRAAAAGGGRRQQHGRREQWRGGGRRGDGEQRGSRRRGGSRNSSALQRRLRWLRRRRGAVGAALRAALPRVRRPVRRPARGGGAPEPFFAASSAPACLSAPQLSPHTYRAHPVSCHAFSCLQMSPPSSAVHTNHQGGAGRAGLCILQDPPPPLQHAGGVLPDHQGGVRLGGSRG